MFLWVEIQGVVRDSEDVRIHSSFFTPSSPPTTFQGTKLKNVGHRENVVVLSNFLLNLLITPSKTTLLFHFLANEMVTPHSLEVRETQTVYVSINYSRG